MVCARLAHPDAESPACSINITRTALLDTAGQDPELYFEAKLAFEKHPWPVLNASAAAQQYIVINEGMSQIRLGNLLAVQTY